MPFLLPSLEPICLSPDILAPIGYDSYDTFVRWVVLAYEELSVV